MKLTVLASAIAAALFTALSPTAAAQGAFVGEVRRFETEDGLRVVLAHQPGREGVEARAFVGLYTRYGRSMETIPGLAHFMEHVFANTRSGLRDFTFPQGARSVDSNAQARVDYVSAWSTMSPDAALPLALALTGKLWSADFSDDIIETQRGRIVAELGRAQTNASWNVSAALEHSFNGRRPLVTEESEIARTLSAADLRTAIAFAYRPEHVVLVIAGDIDPVSLETQLRAHFAHRGPIPDTGIATTRYFQAAQQSRDGGPVVRRLATAEGFAAAYGFTMPPRADREYLAMLVLDQFLLGGRQSSERLWDIARDQDSPLARRMRDEGLRVDALNDGRGYGAASPPLAEDDPAYFEVNFETDALTPRDLRRRVVRALRAVRRHDMTDAALIEARDGLITFYDLWLNAENLRPLGDHLAGMTFHDTNGPGRLRTLRDELGSITPAEVRRVMDRYVIRGDLRLATFGPD